MKHLRAFPAVAALSLLLAPAASAATGSSQAQVGNLISKATFGLSSNKIGGSGVFTIDTSHEMTDGTKPPPSESIFITTEKGTKLNADLVDTCEFSELVATGSLSSACQIVNKAEGKIWVGTGGLGILTTNDIQGYKVEKSACSGLTSGLKMCAAVHASEKTTGVVTDILVAISTPGGRVKLSIPTYSLPEVLGIKPILIAGKFEIDVSKKVTVKEKGKKKKKKLFMLSNPSKCKGSWTISEVRNYTGIGEATNNVKIPCKK